MSDQLPGFQHELKIWGCLFPPFANSLLLWGLIKGLLNLNHVKAFIILLLCNRKSATADFYHHELIGFGVSQSQGIKHVSEIVDFVNRSAWRGACYLHPKGLVDKVTFWGRINSCPYGRQLLIVHRAGHLALPKGFFNSP